MNSLSQPFVSKSLADEKRVGRTKIRCQLKSSINECIGLFSTPEWVLQIASDKPTYQH